MESDRQNKSRYWLLSCRVPVKGETLSYWCPSSNSASTYLGTAQQITWVQHLWHDRFVNKKNWGSCRLCLWILYDSTKLSAVSVDEGKRVRWKQEMTPFGNEVDWLAQVFMVLSKRVVGAFQKNRRCFLKESTMLKGSSQYTFRNHLTAMPWEIVVW